MYMTTVRLCATGRANLEVDGALVHDALWARATPEARLEHMRVVVRPGRVDIAIFCRSAGEQQASSSAIRACELACRESPALSGWQVCRA
jgi:hypothetical protein